ncbi:STOX1 protein, partial [Galbula dea]|nr:STOX1 protein [Galbula dea]
PVLMNPLSQSRSIPLTEEICCTISDMNVGYLMVTQETLMEQLVKKYPGIAVPSHTILYHILDNLMKARKIYRTGDGYFIATPNTYFSTNNTTEDNRRVLLENSCCCSPSSITYLVNIECCADLVKRNIPTVSCCRSCHCFPDQNMLCEQRHQRLMNHEPNRGGKKACSELKPSIQTQGTSTAAENRVWDTIKSLTSVKEKLKSKRFGLGLFWRSASEKEKCKKEYSTFSAQFPPKEWPVRDENDLDDIPRDIEREIIKRINPTLTVDNLIKHTTLMQNKFKEQKKYIGKDTLAEVSMAGPNHLSKDCIQKPQRRTVKHTRKTNPEKQISRSNRKSHIHGLASPNKKLEENLSLPLRNQEPSDVPVESHVIYKKQIQNPFQGLSRRHSFYAKGCKGTGNSQLKSRTWKQEKALQRPWSLDSSKTFETEHLAPEMQADKAKHNKPVQTNRSFLQPKKDSLSENFGYLQGNTLQIDNESKYFLETSISEENIYIRKGKENPGDIKKFPHSYTKDNGMCQEDVKFSLPLTDECCRDKADTVCELLDQTVNEFKNVCLSNHTDNVNPVKKRGVKYRQKTNKKSVFLFKHDCASNPRSMKLESEGFTNSCRLLYQKAQDGDICNSLHLDNNSEGHEPHHLPPGYAFSDTREWSTAVQKLGTVTSLKNYKVNTYLTQYNTTTINKRDSGEHGCKESANFTDSIEGSKEHPKPDCTEESCLCSQVLPIGYRKEETTALTDCTKAAAVADFCPTHEADSSADTLQNFTYQRGEAEPCCALGLQPKEVRDPVGKKDLFFKNVCTVIPGQKHSEGTENHSVTGDSGIDSPR